MITRIVYFLACLLLLGGTAGQAEAGTVKLGRQMLSSASNGVVASQREACDIENCKTCNKKGLCTACETGYNLSGGSCVSKCGENKVWNTVIQACGYPHRCDGKSDPCIKCASNGACLQCEAGLVLNGDGKCSVKCTTIENCEICGGSTCDQCANGYTLSNGQCVRGCGNGQVYNSLIGKCVTKGASCESKACLSCVNDSYCGECYSGFELDPATGECVSSCPANYEWSDSAQECVPSCQDGQVYNPAIKACVKKEAGCDEYCETCVDKLYCSTCKEGFALNAEGICESTCGEGSLWDPEQASCVSCPIYCTSCEGIYEDGRLADVACTSCSKEYGDELKLIDGQCAKHNHDEWGVIENCEYYAQGCILDGKAVNNNGNIRCAGKETVIICKWCNDNYNYNPANGQCTAKGGQVACPAESHCTYCAEGCFTEDGGIGGGGSLCDGRETFAVCKECEEGFHVDEKTGTCVPNKCEDGFYSQYDGSCKVCPEGCDHCKEGCFINGSLGGSGRIGNGICSDGKSSFATTVTCGACVEGYDFTQDEKTGAGICKIQDTEEVICTDGYYRQYDGSCEPCPDGCTVCKEGCVINGVLRGKGLVANGTCSDGSKSKLTCGGCTDGYKYSSTEEKIGICTVKAAENDCEDGYVYNETLKQCTQKGYGCGEGCAKCADGAYCAKCESGWHMTTDTNTSGLAGRCFPQCKTVANCQICDDGTAERCTQCASGFNLYDGKCVPQCADGQYTDGNSCRYCPEGTKPNKKPLATSCDVCSGGYYNSRGENVCENCPNGYELQKGVCVPVVKCESGQYLENGKCLACPENTKPNMKPVATACDAGCSSGYYDAKGYNVCTSCFDGYYLAKEIGKCMPK